MSEDATPPNGQPARISVVNGDLSFAPYPVLVGHFAGDSLSGSEAQLDAALGKALSSRYALGVYPAALGTAIVELHKTAKRPPGVVVGLGDMANFNAGTIRRAMIAGLLELALSPHAGGEPNGVSLVPLGAHAASVSTSDTLLAMLGAIEEVQRRLADRALRRFDHIQLIARMEDDAHRLWHALHRMTAVPPFSNSFHLTDEIEYAAGAARRIAPVGDNDSWRAIQIESAVLADGSTGFHFASVGNRARAEGYLVGTNQTFVQSFISGAVSGQTARLPGSSPARALFELVWPRELKQASHEDRDLRLILDDRAAALPFELMDDRGEAEQQSKPPAVRHGMLRQLVQQSFAPIQFTARGGASALVIGDPRGGTPAIGFGQLDGARKEAEAVADLLETRGGYSVTRLIGDSVTPAQVVQTLLRGGWTIIHIAGHGVYEYAFRSDRDAHAADPSKTLPRYTGVVLNEGIVISPSLLQTMPDPPTLAFINCCDLGTIDTADELALQASGRPEFAASFAAELIALGSRAVIASGWELDDNPALDFALTFYSDLLEGGEAFGEAVRHAREVAYDNYPASTTWGAYQCYGEPDWRLSGSAGGPSPPPPKPVFASPAEALAAIESLESQASVGAGRKEQAAMLNEQLAVIQTYVEARNWLQRPRLAEALGRAHAALGDSAAAIGLFETALAYDASPSLKLVEMLAIFRIRAAAENPDKVAAREQIRHARLLLERLCEIGGEAAERLNAIGGAAKREVVLADEPDIDAALVRMRHTYESALEIARKTNHADGSYSAQMAAVADVILMLRGKNEQTTAALAAFAEALEFGAHPADDYAYNASRAGYLLLGHLSRTNLTDAARQDVVEALRTAWSLSGTAVDFASTLEDLAFAGALLANVQPDAAAWLHAIEQEARAWAETSAIGETA